MFRCVPCVTYTPSTISCSDSSFIKLYRYSNWLLLLWIAQHMIKSRYNKIYHLRSTQLLIWQLNWLFCVSLEYLFTFLQLLDISAFSKLSIAFRIFMRKHVSWLMQQGWPAIIAGHWTSIKCSSSHIKTVHDCWSLIFIQANRVQ